MRKPYIYSDREVVPPDPPGATYDSESGNCWGTATPYEVQSLPVCLWCEIEKLENNKSQLAQRIRGASRELAAASSLLDFSAR
jgi:hypothetical protein